jgi:hypothetical protein
MEEKIRIIEKMCRNWKWGKEVLWDEIKVEQSSKKFKGADTFENFLNFFNVSNFMNIKIFFSKSQEIFEV